MAVFSYDPKQMSLTVGAAQLGGFGDDDFITVEREEDAYIKKVGCSGEVTRLKNGNNTGRVTLRLLQSSISNDQLSIMAALDESQGVGAVPLLGKDLSGRTLFAAPFVWVKKYPRIVFKREVNMWEWTLDTSGLFIYVGGLNA